MGLWWIIRTGQARTGLPLTDGEGASDHRALRWIATCRLLVSYQPQGRSF
jgi:hypothetical protein